MTFDNQLLRQHSCSYYTFQASPECEKVDVIDEDLWRKWTSGFSTNYTRWVANSMMIGAQSSLIAHRNNRENEMARACGDMTDDPYDVPHVFLMTLFRIRTSLMPSYLSDPVIVATSVFALHSTEVCSPVLPFLLYPAHDHVVSCLLGTLQCLPVFALHSTECLVS